MTETSPPYITQRGTWTDAMDQRLDVASAIERLTDKQRTALALWAMGYTQEEIGVVVGASGSWTCRILDSTATQLRHSVT